MINYSTMAAVAFISFILGALGLLFLSKKGANLLSAIKISDTINKLSREITLKDNRIELLAEQNTLLATENKTLKTQISILKKEVKTLLAELRAHKKKMEGMEFIMQQNQKSLKSLQSADRDLDEWKDTVFEALNQFTDLPPSMIEKLTGRKKTEKPKEL